MFRYSLQQLPRSYSYKGTGDAARIEPPPPSPSTFRLCARSSRTPFRPQARDDGTRMPSVLGESRASCRLSSWARSNPGSQQQQYEYTGIQAASQISSTTCDDGSHPPHRPPRCRSESSWLRAGRVWACTRPLQSVRATAEPECRR